MFKSNKYDNLSIKDLKSKFKNENNFNLKDIISEELIPIKLSINQLDPRGNRNTWFDIIELRGRLPYYPPFGCIGIGLDLINKYEDNIWFDNSNFHSEWIFGYLGLTKKKPSETHENCEDIFHAGKKVGKGIYVSSEIKEIERECQILDINDKKYKIALMVKINPKKVRICKHLKGDFVINGIIDEIRPYRILFKVE